VGVGPRAREKQISNMIESTMLLAHNASLLDLKVVTCLYRMILLELTNQVEDGEHHLAAMAPAEVAET
jgi:hypothetical protein